MASVLRKARRRASILTSVIATTSRGWRGSMQRRRTGPAFSEPVTIELYEFEACPYCRLVRESISELQLDVLVRPCPKGGERFRPEAHELAGGKTSFPFLVDGDVKMGESADINAYLWETYADKPAPARTPLTLATSMIASGVRGTHGMKARPSREPERPLELYSFEASPFCRPVRERLCELELPYILRSVAKEQLGDLGTPHVRLSFGEYKPVPGGRREALKRLGGQIQVPYLVDPNTLTDLYESERILKYLEETYAL